MQEKWQKKGYFSPAVVVYGVDVDVVTTSGEEAFNEVGGRWDWEFEEFEG